MTKHKVKVDSFLFGNEMVTTEAGESSILFKDSKGQIIMKVPLALSGAWSARRVARALLTVKSLVEKR